MKTLHIKPILFVLTLSFGSLLGSTLASVDAFASSDDSLCGTCQPNPSDPENLSYCDLTITGGGCESNTGAKCSDNCGMDDVIED